MSKSESSIFKKALIAVLYIAVILFIHVVVVEESKQINRELARNKEILKAKKSLFESKFVEYQKYSSEERIVKYASEKLGLVRNKKTTRRLSVDKSELKKLTKIISEKYD